MHMKIHYTLSALDTHLKYVSGLSIDNLLCDV